MTVSVDLGCGGGPRDDFGADEVWGVDLYAAGPMVRTADLAVDPIPWPDSSVDFVTAYDFVEHIPRLLYVDGVRRSPFVDLMSEVWRVLRPGGRFYANTPAFPHPEVFQDPTHVNVITLATLSYFTDPGWLPLTRTYGFTGTFAGSQSWHPQVPYWLTWDLEAVK